MKNIYKINLIFLLIFSNAIFPQNKIQSENVKEFQKVESKKVILYYPKNYSFLALKTLNIAEKAIQYYSEILRHKLSHQVIIFLYPNFMDFQASHIHFGMLPEGIAGYTEGYLERIVLPYSGNEEEFKYTLTHELVHSFQYDIILNHSNQRNINLPLWLVEGMSEYLSSGTKDMDIFLRDLVISKRIPDLFNLFEGYANYKIGQSVMYFIHKKWSQEHIGLLFKNIILLKDFQKAFFQTFQMNFFDFNIHWKQFIIERYKESYNYNEFKDRITFRYSDILKERTPFHFKPVISKDGKTLVYFSYENFYPVLVIQSIQNALSYGEERKTILYFLKDENFEEWQPLSTKINFDFTGNFIYVPTRKKSKLAIVKYDIKQMKIKKIYNLPFDSIFDPSITNSEEKEKIVFVGNIRSFSDIYILDLEKENYSRITYSFESEQSPVFSLNNKTILFIKKNKDLTYSVISYDLQNKQFTTIFTLNTEIKSLKEGYYKIENQWKKGIYYLANYKNKFSLFFYTDKNHYQILNPNRDIFSFDLYNENSNNEFFTSSLLYSTLEEGTYEIFYKDFSKSNEKFNFFYKISEQNSFLSEKITNWNQKLLEEISNCCKEKSNIYILDSFSTYKPFFYRRGFPFIALTGAVDNKGNSSLVFLGYGSFADLQNKHILEGFLTYQENPVITNGEIQYLYNLNKTQYSSGVYSYNGIFAILNPLDLSLNQIIYNPFQRLLSYSTSGIYGRWKYYFSNYSSFGIQIDLGREEQIFYPKLPEERKNEDIFKNHLTFRSFYLYDNAKYSIYGPLDGFSFLIGYEVPIKTSTYDKEVYQTLMEIRYYELFKNYSLFAYRFFIGAQTGKDSKNFPYRIGGYSTIRGYDFQKFEGKYAFLMNLEYRFTFIEELIFGFPFRWSPGLIRGSLFTDLGSAFDDPNRFQAFDGKNRITKDLKVSIGIGLHWNNFLWFIFPGAIMKIEWASPYDGKRSLPFSRWQGRFSLGFIF